MAVMRYEGPERDVEDYYQVFERSEEIQSITESLLCAELCSKTFHIIAH